MKKMKSKTTNRRVVKNMRELEMLKENLQYQQLLSEKKLLNSSVKIIDSFSGTVKDWAFEFGLSLARHIFSGSGKNSE